MQMKNLLTLTLYAVPALAYASNAIAEPQFLRSSHDLEDPNGYCLEAGILG
jgi:hypothetical protein